MGPKPHLLVVVLETDPKGQANGAKVSRFVQISFLSPCEQV